MTCHNKTNVPGFTSVTPLQDAIDYYSSLDNVLSLVVENVPFGTILQGYGQRALAPVAWVAPELSTAFETYVEAFITSPELEAKVAAVIDVLPMGTIQHGFNFMSQSIAYVF